MKYNSVTSLILSILIASILTGCGAVSWAIPTSDTVKGMTDAMNGVRTTFIFENAKSDIMVIGWSLNKPGGSYAFVLMSKQGVISSINDLPRAVGTQWKSTLDFIVYLEKNGWVSTTPAALTPAIRMSIVSASYMTMAMSMTPFVLVVPVNLLDLDNLLNMGKRRID
jgi:hypothetical protein